MEAVSTGGQRYDGVQVLRCVAALLVVTTHSTFYAQERLGGGATLWDGGVKGVDIFFVISGFVMVLASRRLVGTPDGWRRFMVHRLLRVGPLYWIATTVKLAVALLASRYVLHATVDWPSIVKSYLFLPSRNVDGRVEPLLGVGWTLIFEMFFYALFTLALWLRAGLFTVMVPALVGVASLSVLRPPDFSPWLVYGDPIILEFLFGMGVAHACLNGRAADWRVALAVLLVAAATLPLSGPPWLPRWIGSGVPATLIVWSVASLEPVLRNRVPPHLMFLGAASYALYLFHPLVAPVVPTLLARLGIPAPALSVSLSVAVSIAVACVIHRVVEQPLMRLGRGRGARGRIGWRPAPSRQSAAPP